MSTLIFPLCVTSDPAASANFFDDVFDFAVVADLGWYVQMVHRSNPDQQLAFIEAGHDSIPEKVGSKPGGVMITIECLDVDAHFERVLERDIAVLVEVRDEPWGQRHFIIEDVNGFIIDVVQPIDPAA